MLNNSLKIIREFAKKIATSFFFCALLIVVISIFFSSKINLIFSLVNKVTIIENKKTSTNIHLVKKRLDHYPNYKEKYATIKIPTISLELPVYHGDTLDILKYGVGHYAGSYFPGEGGSIIMAAHNNEGFFRRLPEVKIEDIITISTIYGEFTYQVTNTLITSENDLASFPIKDTEELLILYTCYPVTAIGHTDSRYLVYAKKVGEEYES